MSKEIEWLNERIKWHKECLSGTPQEETIPKLKKDLQMFEDMRNKLKALDIIKEKNVFVWGFIHRKEEIKDFEWTYEYYKTHYGYFHSGYHFELLTEKEYGLLKEVLL